MPRAVLVVDTHSNMKFGARKHKRLLGYSYSDFGPQGSLLWRDMTIAGLGVCLSRPSAACGVGFIDDFRRLDSSPYPIQLSGLIPGGRGIYHEQNSSLAISRDPAILVGK